MSSDPDSEYFCDGISEEILNRLAAFPDLHVIARTSSFALKASGLDARKLSGLLGVRYLLQGSVRRDGDRVRIAAQLVDDSGVQVWSNAYDRELHGIFAIQQEIAEAVATNVVPKIVARSPAEPETLPNLEAYQHYWRGVEIFDKRMPRYAELAEEQFKKAVAIDPQLRRGPCGTGNPLDLPHRVQGAKGRGSHRPSALPEARSRTGACGKGTDAARGAAPTGPPWGRSSVPPGADSRSEHGGRK